MARFLFTVWPFTGCVNPQIAVAEVLQRRGHSMAVYTGRKFRSLIEDLGFTFFPFSQLDEQRVEELVLSPDAIGRNWENPAKLRPQIHDFFLGTVPDQLADIETIRARWSPDAMITDPAMWGPFLILAPRDRFPVAILSYACGCMLPGPGTPPVGLGLPLPKGPWSALKNRVTGACVDWFLGHTRRAASRLRAQHGLPPVCGPVIGLAADLPLYLIPSSPEFDYNRTDLPPCVQYVGPLQWYPPLPRQVWLDRLPAGRPWIHVTEGTLHVRDPFVLRAAAEGLANLPIEVIVTTGDERNPTDLGTPSIAPNIHIRRWVNHSELLPRTAVMVTTAGGGTTMAGMGAGVPLVVIPTEWDKAENAQRVVEAGAGIRLEPGKCTPSKLRNAVEQILRDPSYRENARRIARSLASQGGPERAANLLEEMVAVRAIAHVSEARRSDHAQKL